MIELQALYQGCLLEVIPQQNGSYKCYCIPPSMSGTYVCENDFQTIDGAMEEARAKAREISLDNLLFEHIISSLINKSGQTICPSDLEQSS
ncbi:MAG: hypothetical protein JO235_20610 [Chroococcidiopsidaceae cyanobacterium CP_BM_RX_35]|nr:hypothetical protein [Chroococcidiopsidaceae cyanobacterium CP_BM_RX_35]